MGILFGLLVVGATCAVLAGVVAEGKGLSSGSWALASFFVGPLGLLAVVGMPDKRLHSYIRALAEKQGVTDGDVGVALSRADWENFSLSLGPDEFMTKDNSNTEEIWAAVLERLDRNRKLEASRETSKLYKNLVIVRNKEGMQIAVFTAQSLASGGKRWRLES